MNKDLEDLIKDLNNGKVHGATVSISKLLKISNVSVHNWLTGKALPSEENIDKLAKKTKRQPQDVKKIFASNLFSNNKNSFNSSARETELLKKELELKDKEIELIKMREEILKKAYAKVLADLKKGK